MVSTATFKHVGLGYDTFPNLSLWNVEKIGVYTTLVYMEEIWVSEGPKGPIPI